MSEVKTKSRNHFLSKSDFLKYQICPQYLWLWKNKREVVPQDNPEDVEHRIEQGNEVETYARKLFPEGILIKTKYDTAKLETEKLIRDGVETIFQATVITHDNLLAMADVLKKNPETGKWILYEVKSTTEVKKEHVLDTAFQKAAFTRGGFEIDHVEIIYLNKNYTRFGKIEPEKLFVYGEVDDKIGEIIDTVTEQLNEALEYMQKEDEPVTCSCRLKTRSQHCPTFQYLNPDVPDYSVFNLTRVSNKKLGLLVDMEILNVHDVPEDFKLTDNQKNQVLVAKTGKSLIYERDIRDKLSALKFPLYFLDYETISTALPMYDGCKPYQQLPFQYSLHIMNDIEDSESDLFHKEFLARKEDDVPMPKLLEQMVDDFGPVGTIIVWNQSFEMARNREMAEMYPEYKKFLLDINSRVYDLMEIFSKQLHVHPGFLGKTSIKYVLPVLVPELSYKNLEIQNGSMACLRWYEMVTKKTKEEAEEIYKNLLVYCGLDTLAMFKIYEQLTAL